MEGTRGGWRDIGVIMGMGHMGGSEGDKGGSERAWRGNGESWGNGSSPGTPSNFLLGACEHWVLGCGAYYRAQGGDGRLTTPSAQ